MQLRSKLLGCVLAVSLLAGTAVPLYAQSAATDSPTPPAAPLTPSQQLSKAFAALSGDERTYFMHVAALADPFFEGRAPGTRGNEVAAEYVEFHFRKAGLRPGFTLEQTDGEGMVTNKAEFSTFRQTFTTGRETVPLRQVMAYATGGRAIVLTADVDFAVRGTSGSGTLTAPVVFVGYGIENGKDGYNSFAPMKEGESLEGKVALLLRFEPLAGTGKSRWSEDGTFTRSSSLASKLRAVASRKPAAIVLVTPPGVNDPRAMTLEDTRSSTTGTVQNIPVINLHTTAAEAMIKNSGADLSALRAAADAAPTVSPIDGLSITIEAEVARKPISTDNVGGLLPGRGALKDQYLVIGAHYDHVGYGGMGSRAGARGVGMLHPGADDNASGTAGLIMLAKEMASAYASLGTDSSARSVLFVAFSAEEGGLIGSRHFVRNAPIEASSVYAMLNMDMIGRARTDSLGRPKVEAAGVGTAEGFADLLAPLFEKSGMSVKTLPGGQGPSDHASFYRANIPVLHFFTGLHDQYHMPTDTADLINPTGGVKVMRLVGTVATTLARRPEPLNFTQAKGPSIDYTEPTDEPLATTPAASTAPANVPTPSAPSEPTSTPRRARSGPSTTEPAETAPSAGRGGGRIRFGIAPGDYTEGGGGLQVGDVFDNTPAAAAGLKKGDIITRWNDARITGVEDWMPHFRSAKPGDVVKLTVLRGGETLTLNCTLVAREE